MGDEKWTITGRCDKERAIFSFWFSGKASKVDLSRSFVTVTQIFKIKRRLPLVMVLSSFFFDKVEVWRKIVTNFLQ